MERIGTYRVVKLLTDSRFSRLYLCRDPMLDRLVAVKVFAVDPDSPSPPFTHDEWRERFLAEGRIMARLDHVNLLSIHASGTLSSGRPYHVLPFHPSNLPNLIGFDEDVPSLVTHHGDKARPRALAADSALAILGQVLRGLAHLHGQGIVHRDIKASNVVLTARDGGIARICDFGMAKVGTAPDMRKGAWVGSDDYIAPEQRRDAGLATDRADIYSAAVLAWRMLTGALPPSDAGAMGLAMPDLAAPAANAILRGLDPDPGRRPSAREFLAALSVRRQFKAVADNG